LRNIEINSSGALFTLDGSDKPINTLKIVENSQLPFTAVYIDDQPLFDAEIWRGKIFVAKVPPDSAFTRAVYYSLQSGSYPEPEALTANNSAIHLVRIQNDMTETKRQMHENDWVAFRGMFNIWNLNRTDMKNLIHKLYNDEDLAIEMIQNVREPVIRDQVHRQLDRVIFNYLAAFRAVIESSRDLISKYPESNLANKYSEFRETFMTPEGQFVDKLRNYYMHYDLPVSGQQFSFPDQGTKFKYSILADIKALLRYNGWSRETRIFLENQNSELDLGQILLDHQETAGEQWVWLQEQFPVLHQVEIYKYNQLVNAYNWVLSGGLRGAMPVIFK